MMFAGGKVIVSQAGLRVVERFGRLPFHTMTITGLCRIPGLPQLNVWSPLPPDDGVICFKTSADRFWKIESLAELAPLAGDSTDWYTGIRRLPALFDHMLEQQACNVAITADLPSGKITDVSFSVFGDTAQYGERQYVEFSEVMLKWTVVFPFDAANRKSWQLQHLQV